MLTTNLEMESFTYRISESAAALLVGHLAHDNDLSEELQIQLIEQMQNYSIRVQSIDKESLCLGKGFAQFVPNNRSMMIDRQTLMDLHTAGNFTPSEPAAVLTRLAGLDDPTSKL